MNIRYVIHTRKSVEDEDRQILNLETRVRFPVPLPTTYCYVALPKGLVGPRLFGRIAQYPSVVTSRGHNMGHSPGWLRLR